MKIRVPKVACPVCLAREQPVIAWLRARKITPGAGLDLNGAVRYDAYLLMDCEREICDYAEIHLPEDLLNLNNQAEGDPP